MGKIAFVFSGQGDQHPGMGKEIAEQYTAAAEIFDLCDRIRPGTSHQCFEGTEEELRETKNTQPCLFAMELATAEALRDQGVTPDEVAGFSLGELVAAVFAGMFDAETGFRLVCRRGELMQREAERFDTAMAAVVRLTEEQVLEICGQYEDVYPVNFNCPGQTTVSCLSSQMSEFSAAVKAAGGWTVPLKVKGGFHSPFMEQAAKDFRDALAEADIRKGDITLWSDLTAQRYTDDVVDLLSRQISSPVQWEKLVRGMIADGVDTFIEIGPSKTLVNMIKKTDPAVKALTATEYLAELELC